MAQICFGYNNEGLDVDGAAAALERAGFAVHRLPEEYRGLMQIPDDDFIEAVTTGRGESDDEMHDLWEEVDAIVGKFGGECTECPGPIGVEYTPFYELFETRKVSK
jgi:hypothetical protein